MSIATTQEIIDRSNVSIYLSANDNSRGQLFGNRLAAPGSPVSIALICNALTWGNDGGAQTTEDIRQMSNYLEWLIGMYGQEAQFIISGGGGGSVVPGGGGTGSSSIYPFIITSANFESDGVSYNDSRIVGDNLSLFIDEYNQQWLLAPTSFVYTATGIQIIAPGFNANSFSYTIMVQKINSVPSTSTPGSILAFTLDATPFSSSNSLTPTTIYYSYSTTQIVLPLGTATISFTCLFPKLGGGTFEDDYTSPAISYSAVDNGDGNWLYTATNVNVPINTALDFTTN